LERREPVALNIPAPGRPPDIRRQYTHNWADGTIVERGEHAPGVPFARIADPDGNVLEI
jgi:catechol 2,3-dioxygenase-like lactoylglutathione lyase family enzyme